MGFGQFRTTENHGRDIAGVIACLRQNAAIPIWLVGTSWGTVSAANAAARLKAPDAADGLVLTATITASSRQMTALPLSVDLSAIAIPTLLVHNTEDQCVICPFAKAPIAPWLPRHRRPGGGGDWPVDQRRLIRSGHRDPARDRQAHARRRPLHQYFTAEPEPFRGAAARAALPFAHAFDQTALLHQAPEILLVERHARERFHALL